MNLTEKQERFCQEYIKTGNKSDAYRIAYDTEKMKPNTINRKSYELFKTEKISARIGLLQGDLREDCKVELNMLVKELLTSLQFDPMDLYNSIGEMKPLEEIPAHIRRNISEMGVRSVGSGEMSREVTYAKTIDKHKTIDTLSKMFGFYAPEKKELSGEVATRRIINLNPTK